MPDDSQTSSKLQFLMAAQPEETHAVFAARLRRDLVPRLLDQGPRRLTLHLTVEPPPRVAVIPFRRAPQALLSIHGGVADGADPWLDLLEDAGPLRAGYLVDESTPVNATDRPAPGSGQVTPGAGLLTLLRRNPKLDPDTFRSEWFGKHTPMSLEIHPLWHYERNEVVSPVVPGSPVLDGIVTEHFRTRADLLNPVRLFGGPVRCLPNMARVGLHIRHFMDLHTMETYFVQEERLA